MKQGYNSPSFLAPEKHYESVCYLQKWKMTHIVLLSRSILPQPHRKSFFGAKITNLYAERFILTFFLDMIVQFFYFYTRTAVFFRMWTQTGWLVNLSVFFVDWYKKISGCRHHVQTMSGDFFEYSYEKPELLYEYPGKLPDVYFNFSAFFPVGLPFRESVPTESCFRILNSFSPGSSSGSASRTIRFVLCMMQLSMISLRVVTSKSISHTCSAALKKVASVLKRKLRTVSKHVCVPMPVMRWISDFDTCDRAYSVSMNFLNSLSHSSICCFVGSHEAYNFPKYFISLVSRGLSLPYRAVINTLPIGIFTDERQERKFTCQVLLMTQR